jgi:F-type H+-transporting ATPase subunit b
MVNINWSTLLFQIINFLVMVLILTRFFFKPVVRILDERSKKVTSALDEAQRREQEAAEIRTQYEKKLAETQEQVLAMKQQAQEDVDQARQRVLDDTRAEIQKMREKTERELGEARHQAIIQHQHELGSLVTTLSGQLVQETGGVPFQKASLEDFVTRLIEMPSEEYRRALAALEATAEAGAEASADASDGASGEGEVLHVQLVSAYEADAESIARIEQRLQEMTGRQVTIRRKVDPSLIAGARMRFGDVVIDGSVAGQLRELGERYLHELEQSKA